MYETDTLTETNSNSTWKWMLGIGLFLSFGVLACFGLYCQGRTVRFSEYITDLRNMKPANLS